MIAEFIDRLLVEQVEEELWLVVRPLRVRFTPSLTAVNGTDIPVLTVPNGFTTDFGSVPRTILLFLLAGGLGEGAAAVHDYLYATGIVPRKTADDAFLACLKALGISHWRRQLMYRAVLLFGGRYYKRGFKS